MSIDPYRTLGLSANATLAEVKAAYRRLAKVHHPDTAGESAMPRFLAIQAAYEAILTRRRSGRRATGAPAPPWQADPARARATRTSWRPRRTRPDDTDDTGPARERPSGERTGRRSSQGARPRSRPSDASTGQRRTRKATLGSTSYDDVDREPFDPEWAGASWYGTASGTYWTLNPKEYADPRKHGPEYQARARRSTPDSTSDDSSEAGEAAAAGDATDDDATGAPFAASAEAAWSDARSTDAGRGAWSQGAPIDRRGVAWTGDGPSWSLLLGRLLDPPRGPADRLIVALLAWPPLGVALATVVGELTGCVRFAATCTGDMPSTATLAIVLGQMAILGLLIAIPRLAALAVGGTLAVAAAAGPVALLLTAAGASRDPSAAGRVLVEALAIAWIVGLGLAIRRRIRAPVPS
jgi:curved DNA-binding protein CbpA